MTQKNMRGLALGLVLVCTAGLLSAEGFKLELGANAAATDITGVNYANAAFESTWQPALDPYANLTWALKIDDANALTLGFNVDDNILFEAAKKASKTKLAVPGDSTTYGNYNSTGADGVWAQGVKIMPLGTFKSGDFSATLQLPLFMNFASTAVTSDAVMAMGSKGLKYVASWMANKTKNIASAANQAIPYDGTNSILFAACPKLSYKISLGKDFAITPLVESEIAISPLWFADIMGTISILTGPVTTDLKASFYNTPNDPNDLDAVVSGALFYTYLDPKVSLDFGPLGAKGLKASVAASIPVTTSTNAAGAATALYGASITPGVAWKIGDFGLEFTSMFSNIDQGITGSPASTPTFTNQLEWDPKLKLSYTFSF